jgi:hypothetical protein
MRLLNGITIYGTKKFHAGMVISEFNLLNIGAVVTDLLLSHLKSARAQRPGDTELLR